jgi:hypothetical protein
MVISFRVYCLAEHHGWEHDVDGSPSAHGSQEEQKEREVAGAR